MGKRRLGDGAPFLRGFGEASGKRVAGSRLMARTGRRFVSAGDDVGKGLLVEVRESAKGAFFDGVDLDGMLDLARIGICELLLVREQALGQRVS